MKFGIYVLYKRCTSWKLYFPYFLTDLYKILHKMSSSIATTIKVDCHEIRLSLSSALHRAVNACISTYSRYIAQLGEILFSRTARDAAEKERHW
jgi:hypothetical protein